MHIDTRVPGSQHGGYVSICIPSNDDMNSNPHACARMWAFTQKERNENNKSAKNAKE